MKKQNLLITAMLLLVASVFANGDLKRSTTTRNLTLETTYASIKVKGNVEVVLVPTHSMTIDMEGYDKFLDATKIEVVNDELRISGGKGSSKNRVTVYVPVHDLGLVTLGEGANLSSKGRIRTPSLRIRIEGISAVNVKNYGNIIVDSDDTHQFQYEKSERSIIRIEKAS